MINKGVVTNVGYKNNQEVSFGTPSFVLSSVDKYLKFAQAVWLTVSAAVPASNESWVSVAATSYGLTNNIFGLWNGNFAMNASGHINNTFLDVSKNVLNLSSRPLASDEFDRLMDKGIIVGFGYITNNNIIQPNMLSSVETYLKFAEAVWLQLSAAVPAAAGDSVSVASIVEQWAVPLSADQERYINLYFDAIEDDFVTALEVFDRMIDKGVVTNVGYKDDQEVSFGTPSFVLSSVDTYLKFAEAVWLTVSAAVPASNESWVSVAATSYGLTNNIFGLWNSNFAINASGNFVNNFLDAAKNILDLPSRPLTYQEFDRITDKGMVVGFGYITNNNIIQPNMLSSVETYLKFAEEVWLTVSAAIPAAAGDSVSVASIVEQWAVPLSADQERYLDIYFDAIEDDFVTAPEVFDRITDKGMVTNVGYKDNQEVSFGTPSFVLSSVETYLKFAEEVWLTVSPAVPASNESWVSVAATSYGLTNNIFGLWNGNFAINASGNFVNNFLDAAKNILDLPSRPLTYQEFDRITDKGMVVGFGYITNNNIIQPNMLSSVETYLKFAEAVWLTVSAAIPAAAGDSVSVASIVDVGPFPLSANQIHYINRFVDHLTPDTTSTNADVLFAFMDKGMVTNVGYRDTQEVSFGSPSIVLSNVETYLKFAEAVWLTLPVAVPASLQNNPISLASIVGGWYLYDIHQRIFAIGNDNFVYDWSGSVKNIFLNLPKNMLEINWQYGGLSTYQRVSYLLDKGLAVGLQWLTDYRWGIPASVASVETYLKLIESMGLYHFSADPASLSLATIYYPDWISDFSPAQRAYFKQYFDLLPLQDASVLFTLLDRGMVTNIGYRDGHDVAIWLPWFVFANIETYIKLIEWLWIANYLGRWAIETNTFDVGINNFAVDTSGAMRNPFLDIPLALQKRMSKIWPDPIVGMENLLIHGVVVHFGYPEVSVIWVPTLLSCVEKYLGFMSDLWLTDIEASFPTQPSYVNPFTPHQEAFFSTMFSGIINTTRFVDMLNTQYRLLCGWMVVETKVDRWYSDPRPTPWNTTALLSGISSSGNGIVGLSVPFTNPGGTDDILMISSDVYTQHYIDGWLYDTLTHNRFANVDLWWEVVTYGQPWNAFVPRCGDGTIQTPNSSGLNEICDEWVLNGQSWHCNMTCTGIIATGWTVWWWTGWAGGWSAGGGWGGWGGWWGWGGEVFTIVPVSSLGATHGSFTGIDELEIAYKWAYGLDITTMPTMQKANMEGKLIRSHLAKMIVSYVVNVLGRKPDLTKSCVFTDIDSQSAELKSYIIRACQLGLMWYKHDGVTIDSTFSPRENVSRAQFGTVLSRILWGTQNNAAAPNQLRYKNHLQALQQASIMNNISYPMMNEVRGYVILMLMKSQQNMKQ